MTATVPTCLACGSEHLDPFFDVRDVPVHSCLLMPTREEALAYPRGDISLSLCEGCGFIQNTLFDPSVHEYSPRYEETQAFSPHFQRFLRALARDVVTRHGLAGGHAVEIGSGKGEFLVMLCEEGCGRATGYDPGYRPERTASAARDQIRFVPEMFDERTPLADADLVACRHTLEHIRDVGAFVGAVRRAIGRRTDTGVFFELPDATRILRERAFWDIYYEHASYFTLGALVRLFRAEGFRVTRAELVYGGQYLVLDASPATAGDGEQHRQIPGEDDLAETRRLVSAFREDAPRRVRAWGEELCGRRAAGQRVALWGSGSKAVSLLTTAGAGGTVEAVVDINPHKQGRFMPGTGEPIIAPTNLRALRPDVVIVMNAIYEDEIRAELERLGLDPELVFLP